MKSILRSVFCLFLVILIFSLSACGGFAPSGAGEEVSSAQSQTDEEALYQSSDFLITYVNSRFFKSVNDPQKAYARADIDRLWLSSLLTDGRQELLCENISPGTWEEEEERVRNDLALREQLSDGKLRFEISAKDYFSRESTGYDKLSDDDIVLYSTKNFDPVLTKVTYIDYDSSEAEPKEYWIKGFSQKLHETDNRFNPPVIIRESFSFTYNGKIFEIVTACNTLIDRETTKSYEEIPKITAVPADRDILVYNMTLVFIDGQLTDLSDEFYSPYIGVIKKDALSYNEQYSRYMEYFTWQYDENGNLRLFPLFINEFEIREIDSWNLFLFMDVDADETPELVYVYDSHYPNSGFKGAIAYEITEDNTLKKDLICLYC